MDWIADIRKAPIAESSKKQYVDNLRTLVKLMDNASLADLVSQPNRVIPAIAKRYESPHTRKSMVSAIKALLKHVPGLKVKYAAAAETYHQAFKEVDKKIFDDTASCVPSGRETAGWVKWEDIRAKQQSLERLDYASPDHLLLSMYTLIEPARSDYGKIKIVGDIQETSAPDQNFLVLPRNGAMKAVLVLKMYKTRGRYGTFKREFPENLVRIIRQSLANTPREYLFVDISGEPYENKNSFTKHANRAFHRIFGRGLSISLVRHSFISALDFNESTPAELIQHSKYMMHSIGMQQLYRRKVPDAGTSTATSKPARSSMMFPASTGPATSPANPAKPSGSWVSGSSSDSDEGYRVYLV